MGAEGGTVERQFWWSLTHQRVEEGPGSPNAERMGPYATYEEAASAIDRAKERTAEQDAKDTDWDS
ncbi:MAG: hypothetical protein ACXV2H_12615 [Actinomycetes bacterium]